MKKRCVPIERMGMALFVALCLLIPGCGKGDAGTADSQVSFETVRLEEDLPSVPGAQLLEQEGENPAGDLQEAFGKCMVKIYGGTLVGSGVILGGNPRELIIATAGHVFSQNVTEVTVQFFDGFQVTVRDYVLSEHTDLALLRIPREELLEVKVREGGVSETYDHGPDYRSVVADREAYDAVRVGDCVIAMGSYSGVAEDAYAGTLEMDYVYVEDFEAYMMIARVPVKPGMSGGGLFDTRGNLLGILCGVSQEELVAVVPLTSVTSLVEIEGEIMKIL